MKLDETVYCLRCSCKLRKILPRRKRWKELKLTNNMPCLHVKIVGKEVTEFKNKNEAPISISEMVGELEKLIGKKQVTAIFD